MDMSSLVHRQFPSSVYNNMYTALHKLPHNIVLACGVGWGGGDSWDSILAGGGGIHIIS